MREQLIIIQKKEQELTYKLENIKSQSEKEMSEKGSLFGVGDSGGKFFKRNGTMRSKEEENLADTINQINKA